MRVIRYSFVLIALDSEEEDYMDTASQVSEEPVKKKLKDKRREDIEIDWKAQGFKFFLSSNVRTCCFPVSYR